MGRAARGLESVLQTCQPPLRAAGEERARQGRCRCRMGRVAPGAAGGGGLVNVEVAPGALSQGPEGQLGCGLPFMLHCDPQTPCLPVSALTARGCVCEPGTSRHCTGGLRVRWGGTGQQGVPLPAHPRQPRDNGGKAWWSRARSGSQPPTTSRRAGWLSSQAPCVCFRWLSTLPPDGHGPLQVGAVESMATKHGS